MGNKAFFDNGHLSVTIKVYWWRDALNFGDWITPYLLKKLGLNFEYAPIRRAQLISVGSTVSMALNVLDLIWRSKKMVVLGSGLILNPKWSITYYLRLRLLDIRLVRGPLTRQAISKFIKQDIPCGDPGLLVSSYYEKKTVTNQRTIGLIPHHFGMRNLPS